MRKKIHLSSENLILEDQRESEGKVFQSATGKTGAGKAPANSLIPESLLSYQTWKQIYLRLSVLHT